MAFSGDKWKGYRCMTDRRTREDRATQFVNIGDWVLQWIRFINWLPKYLSVFSERYTVLLSGSLLKATLLYWRRQPWWIWPWWWSSGEERHCLQSWYPMKRSILKQYSFESFWNVTCTHQWWHHGHGQQDKQKMASYEKCSWHDQGFQLLNWNAINNMQ